MADLLPATPGLPEKPNPGRRWRVLVGALAALAIVVAAGLVWRWRTAGPTATDTLVYIRQGTSLAGAARTLAKAGVISDPALFRQMARVAGARTSIKPGEYRLPRGVSMARVLVILQAGDVLQRRITFAEGMSAVQIQERLLADEMLAGPVGLPAEGSVLPETYSFARGTPRQRILDQSQDAMAKVLARAWAQRSAELPFRTPEEAVILASIIEKETSKKAELAKVAGVYINRLRIGMKLQADPTIIYPITRGKPLGRRIRRSEIDAINDYNTYTRDGLPAGPIAMPGRLAIEAVLNPETTDALFFVADGSGGHVFASTGAEHERNVANWRRYRADNGI